MEIRALSARDLPENTVKVVELKGIEIGIINDRGTLRAFRNLCPHQGGPVCEGVRMPKVCMELSQTGTFRRHSFDEQRIHLVCPWHGWEFDIETGEAAGDPAYRLRQFPVTERDGEVYVTL